jgi:CDP-L-myo-inositol myo-inositolphosphotransferase
MNVVLLAAGLGSRLGTLTRDLPKALIRVGGQPLLLHALSFARRLRPSRIIVVGGFCFPLVRDTLAKFRGGKNASEAPIELVENPHFRDGNLVSLLTAKPFLPEGFLVMNVDHIYRPSIAAVVVPEVAEVTAFIDTDRKLGDDDMKVERGDDGRIVAIAKTLSRFDCGYVGMTRVPDARLDRYFREADRALAEEGRAIHVERILARLAKTDAAPACRDISGHGWLEVDTPDERAAAEATLTSAAWVGWA